MPNRVGNFLFQINQSKLSNMKKGLFFLLFFLFNFNTLFAQADVNIDSLYNIYSENVKYDYLFRDKLRSSVHEGNSGYLIDLKGDTIFGQLFLNVDGIHVKVKNENFKNNYRADKYRILKYGERTFISKKFDMFAVNAEILESGKIKFYAFEQNEQATPSPINMSINHSGTVVFYLEKDSVIYGPFNSNFIDFLDGFSLVSASIKDYKTLYERVQQKQFKYSDLRTIVKIYNNWYEKSSAKN